ncbi:MAG: tetratricopeptide repeat protein [Clostridia bacterium]|nr:tetratricopeptide repeat protein [Clostridia bacterium]
MDYIMEQSDGYIAGVRKTAASLYKNKDLDHRFSEIERAWKEAKNAGRDTLPGKYYFDIFVLRFYSREGSGIEELQRLMRGCEPSVGYYVLSRLLAKDNCRNNLVITTNFDSLMEKAIFAFTEQAPVAVSHEALLEAMDWKVRYPIVAKVHRDLLFKPLNSTREVSELKEGWQEPLRRVLENYTPIVIGYAGADKSLMSFFEDNGTSFSNGLYWCYREQSGEPENRIKALVKSKGGFLVPIEGFDELMVRIGMHSKKKLIRDPDDDTLLNELQERYDENIEKLKAALKATIKSIEAADPTSPWGYFNRAYRYFEEGKLEEAIADYDKAIELKPDDADAYNNRGNVHDELGEYKKAIEDYDEAIKLKTDYADAYNNRGVAHADLGEYKKAIEDYDKAIELKPDLAEAYNNRGVAHSKLYEYEKAVADYGKAIELEPDDADAYYNRGIAHGKLGDAHADLDENKKAIADFSKAIDLKPDDADAYYNRGVAHGELGEPDKAIADFSKAIELKHDYAAAYNNRGNVHYKLGDAHADLDEYKKAIADYDKAIKLKPDYVIAYIGRALAHIKLGKADKASADYNKAIELDPTLKSDE